MRSDLALAIPRSGGWTSMMKAIDEPTRSPRGEVRDPQPLVAEAVNWRLTIRRRTAGPPPWFS